jgi:hypothetical protein
MYCFRIDQGHLAAEFFAMQKGRGRCLKFEPDEKSYRVTQWDRGDQNSELFLGMVNLETVPGGSNPAPGTSNFPVSKLHLTQNQKVVYVPGNFEHTRSVLESVIFKLHGKFRSIQPIADRPMHWTLGAGEMDFAAQIGDGIYERVLMSSANVFESEP